MDPKELGALGGALSALLAALSYRAKIRHERRRATRTVLYYLLELHHVVLRLQEVSQSLSSNFPAVLKRQFGVKGVTLSDPHLQAAMRGAMPALVAFGREQMEGTVADIAEGFSKALAEVAKEDPILAFRLRGRDQLMLLSQKISRFLVQHADQFSLGEKGTESTELFLDDLVGSAAIEELEVAIRATAWKCDLMTHIRSKILLARKVKAGAPEDLKKVVAWIVEKALSLHSTSTAGPQGTA